MQLLRDLGEVLRATWAEWEDLASLLRHGALILALAGLPFFVLALSGSPNSDRGPDGNPIELFEPAS